MFQRVGTGGSYDALYLIDADARRTLIALDTVESLVLRPSVSPSGDAVVWLRWTFPNAGSAYDVHTTDLSGADPARRVSFLGNAEGPPAWTPDGSAVVLLVEEGLAPPNRWGLYRHVLATEVTELLLTFALDTGQAIRCPNVTSLSFSKVSVSVQGGLAYLCAGDIWGADTPADTLGVLEQRDSGPIYAAEWSPDGEQIAFIEVVHDVGNVVSSSLKVHDRATGVARLVATVPGSGSGLWHLTTLVSLCWLPGGTHIAFSAPRTGATSGGIMRSSVFVVGADGTGLVQVTTAADVFDHSVSCTR